MEKETTRIISHRRVAKFVVIMETHETGKEAMKQAIAKQVAGWEYSDDIDMYHRIEDINHKKFILQTLEKVKVEGV